MSDDQSKELYRIEDAKQRKRVADFEEVEDPTDRRSEIASARMLLESAINSGNHSVANSLLANLDRLQKNEHRRLVCQSELLTKQAVRRFTDKVVEAIAAVLPKHLEVGWEDAMVEISENLDSAFDELKNQPSDIEKVRLPR